ncbi:MAG TPA: hypothetical protein VHG91_10015 [Longimicrobium sp.]|nr:hypothetical protein [Longimicrobium sp.]
MKLRILFAAALLAAAAACSASPTVPDSVSPDVVPALDSTAVTTNEGGGTMGSGNRQ